MTANEKIALLRTAMAKETIDAFVVFSADPHMSEYLPEEWLERVWLTGFTGSAGFVVVTQNKAALWTDGRYFVQAPKELQGSEIMLMKDGVEGTPHFIDWLISEVPTSGRVAVNTLATSHAQWVDMETRLRANDRELIHFPLLDTVWVDRAATHHTHPIYVHPLERAGMSISDKISRIREKMAAEKATYHVISSLDDVAWTLNLRGSDVDYNPVFLGYILLGSAECILFVNSDKLTAEAKQALSDAGVEVKPYTSFYSHLQTLQGERVWVSPNSNQSIIETLKPHATLVLAAVPGNLMKAQKNEVELAGFRTVMQRDGVAMVKFIHWLKHQVGKETMTEYTIGEKLHEFRAQGENFVGASFSSIVGYKSNGAVVHYSATEADALEVTNSGSILIDSGGQYAEGTTDITRTLSLGEVSQDVIDDATRVLQGMIRLSMVKFPKGTKGVHLDAITRMPLWMHGKDYAHGTGHGVGSFMNVHEGPQNIRKDMNPQELLPGMVCSNEPGFYVEGAYGIRHENLVAVRETEKTPYGNFLEFETLTVCPFDRSLINTSLLSSEEIGWLNQYHAWCQEKLEDHLEGDVKAWFLEQVKPL